MDIEHEHKEQPRPYTVVDITCPWDRDNPFFVTILLRKPKESIEEMLIRYRTHPYGILLFEGGLTGVALDSLDRGMISEKIAEAELAEGEEKKNRIQGTTDHVQ